MRPAKDRVVEEAGPAHRPARPRRSAVPGRARRNPAATKERILRAGVAEFARHGLNGARIDRIAARAKSNIRMIYHYFGGKEQLYLAALERIYQRVRSAERRLNLSNVEPAEGMVRLVDFTFTHLLQNPEFVSLVCGENLLRGKYLEKSRLVPETAMPLVEAIKDLLARGQRTGVFRKQVDPVQLYVTILSVCFTHISNRYTLSIMFRKDVGDAAWLESRRQHAQEVVLSFLRSEAGSVDLTAAR